MNTTDPVAFLLSEHRRIMAAVDAVRRALPDLRSPEDFRRHLPALLAFGDALTYDIPAHAGKEDDIFFPPIEAIIGREGGPTGVMRAEHKEIHAAALKLSEVIRELNTVEHPAILAGTQAYEAQIRAVQAGAGDLAAFVAHTHELIDLLDRHFGKEEQVLFPMYNQLVEPSVRAEVARRMAGR